MKDNNNRNNNNHHRPPPQDRPTTTSDENVGTTTTTSSSSSSSSSIIPEKIPLLDPQGEPAVLYLDDESQPLFGYSFGSSLLEHDQQQKSDNKNNNNNNNDDDVVDNEEEVDDEIGMSRSGEVVFNTGMVGYPEALTDPSYRGQILVLTYPLVGNYGVPDEAVLDEYDLPKYFESSQIHISGLVVSSYSWEHSHWAATKSLSQWLRKANIPGIYGVDTRALTKKIREMGSTLLGRIQIFSNEVMKDLNCLATTATGAAGDDDDDEFNNKSATLLQDHSSAAAAIPVPITTGMKKMKESPTLIHKIALSKMNKIPFMNPNERNLVNEVSTKTIKVYGKNNTPSILAYDCGMKYNIIRYFVTIHKVKLTIVPYNYNLELNSAKIVYDGLFLSNGPGDPNMCADTVQSIKYALTLNPPKPIFGICLGNQLLALAAGAKTYKMKYGNRGMNQPCIDLRTGRCYITPQNHGFAVESHSLPPYWKPLFLNANDHTNEGIVHTTRPFFSVQFHPEASGGPTDTAFLFEKFVGYVRKQPQALVLQSESSYLRRGYKKVLLVGSGGLSIGQAGEFDYSGSQCIKALKEEGIEVILINPNIATVQTSQDATMGADRVYFLPIRKQVVTDIIKKEHPDGIIVSMGGQTALNVGIELYKSGILKTHGVDVLGTQIPAIEATEDREIFSQKLREIDETIALSYSANTIKEAVDAANKIGYPVLIRAAFALGGLGSGFASNEKELCSLAAKAFSNSSQILIDQDLRGWKELEYEVVRDCQDNCVTVCNMENFDPLGIHTGDSIVVAPSQTLTNREYFMLRRTAIKVVRHLGIVGECNIQYALNPESEKYCIIEVNARLSRSSALASKATGYPLAYVATKLSLGKDLVSIRNSVTKTTTACFEPSLDYCVLKMPRWDLKKFQHVSNTLGSSMLSVGEVMAIGRTFEEVIQKACRMVNHSLDGLEGEESNLIDLNILNNNNNHNHNNNEAVDNNGNKTNKKTTTTTTTTTTRRIASLDEQLKSATDTRLFAVQYAFELGYTVDEVYELTKIDCWFLNKLSNIAKMRKACLTFAESSICNLSSSSSSSSSSLDNGGEQNLGKRLETFLTMERMRALKRCGFSDKQISRYTGCGSALNGEAYIRALRKRLGVLPCVKQIDTLAAEFPAQTNYLYVTYGGYEDDVSSYNPNQQNNYYLRDSLVATKPQTKRVVERKEISTLKERGVMVLGCGAYCIGSSVEFDWCAVSCVRQLRRDGFKSIIVNYNPETVSTDYDESDRLYFEELSLERILDIYEREGAGGIVVSVGGQIPNCLAGPLNQSGVKILGTSASNIENAEDRQKFSDMLDSMKLNQPAWSVLTSSDDAKNFAARVGYPVLVRPSFVLSGAAMRVAIDETQLVNFLGLAAQVSSDKPVVVTKFVIDAKEIEFDAVASQGTILNYAIGEHLENAGVHSGDATVILPAQKLYVHTIRQIKRYSSAIAQALQITGPFNIQFMAKGNEVQVIECNLRASRTFPFVSKTLNHNFISLATRAMVGLDVTPYRISLLDIEYVCVKAPMFSFTRLRGADPTLGVEMASTGEVACFGTDAHEAFLQAMLSTGFKLPPRKGNILLSIASDEYRAEFLHAAHIFAKLKYNLFGTPGTSNYYNSKHGLNVKVVSKPDNEDDHSDCITTGAPSALKVIRESKIHLIINVSDRTTRKDEISSGYIIRRAAVDFDVSLVTNVKCAIQIAECLDRGYDTFRVRHIGQFYRLPTVGWSK